MPPLQITSLEVTSVIGCNNDVRRDCNAQNDEDIYPVIVRNTDTGKMALVYAIDVYFLEDGMS